MEPRLYVRLRRPVSKSMWTAGSWRAYFHRSPVSAAVMQHCRQTDRCVARVCRLLQVYDARWRHPIQMSGDNMTRDQRHRLMTRRPWQRTTPWRRWQQQQLAGQRLRIIYEQLVCSSSNLYRGVCSHVFQRWVDCVGFNVPLNTL